jgi:hypothetical protein
MGIFGTKNYTGSGSTTSGNRELSPMLESELLDMLPPGSKIKINSLLGNSEAYGFATEIKEYLTERGYEVDGVYQVVYTDPVDGQIVESPSNQGEPFNIIIGNRE